MTIVETRYEHTILDEKDIPIIAGTTMKVIELVLDSRASPLKVASWRLNVTV